MAIASPCLEICKFERKGDLRVGCLRTTEKIRLWRKLADHKHHEIFAEHRRREAKRASRHAVFRVQFE